MQPRCICCQADVSQGRLLRLCLPAVYSCVTGVLSVYACRPGRWWRCAHGIEPRPPQALHSGAEQLGSCHGVCSCQIPSVDCGSLRPALHVAPHTSAALSHNQLCLSLAGKTCMRGWSWSLRCPAADATATCLASGRGALAVPGRVRHLPQNCACCATSPRKISCPPSGTTLASG